MNTRLMNNSFSLSRRQLLLAGMAAVSRRSNYAKPPEKSLKEFLGQA